MTSARWVYHAKGYDSFENLALEEYLLSWLPPRACMLYLWQNARTVVIGRNQNAWRECDVGALEADHGSLARRPSGGGAVYHDQGNLNFTFLFHQDAYDVARQSRVILRAVRGLGINAVCDGRNDMTVEGKKFSGNAFYRIKNRALHHGTLMVDTDLEDLAKYLKVSPLKLSAKGVSSVRARVVNLRALKGEVTVPLLAQALMQAFTEEYGGPAQTFPTESIDTEAVSALKARYASRDWRFGRHIPFTGEAETRFDWGQVRLVWNAEAGRIAECALYSDAMDAEQITAIPASLRGCQLCGAAMAAALSSMQDTRMHADLCAWLTDLFGGGEPCMI